MSAQAPDFKPDQLLPGTKYRVVRQIGAGGMGVVYQVVKPPEIQGVLKLMSTELVEHYEFRTRFLDEVRVLAQLDHPNIVKVFDYDTLADATPYYVMELLHGRTVRDVLATMGTIPAKVAFEITRQLCEALHAAHTHSIPVVHRDIKPENIFLHAPRHGEPVVKLIDFGVIAVADRTHDGTFVGTWKYAAPEQIRGERAVPATDLYAVALVLYEMLCGVGPFERYETGPLISRAHLFEAPPPLSKFAPWVPPSIVSLIEITLSKDARFRPRDAYAFAERLYELEWANDGKDPHDRTAEGPLRRILSNVGAPLPAAGKMPPRNLELPLAAPLTAGKHEGPTLRGVGDGKTHEPTSPGEDALLDGLRARGGSVDSRPLSKKERASAPGSEPLDHTPRYPNVVNRPAAPAGPVTAVSPGGLLPTLDAPLSDPKLRSGPVDTDTFSSQESDTRRPARPRRGWLGLVALLGILTVLGATVAVALRLRVKPAPPTTTAAALESTAVASFVAAPPPAPAPSPPAASVSASAALPPPVAPPPVVAGRAHGHAKTESSVSAPIRTIEPATPSTTAPKPAPPPPQDDSLIRSL